MNTLNEALAREHLHELQRAAEQSRVFRHAVSARRLRRLTRLAHSAVERQTRSSEQHARSAELATAADYSLVR